MNIQEGKGEGYNNGYAVASSEKKGIYRVSNFQYCEGLLLYVLSGCLVFSSLAIILLRKR